MTRKTIFAALFLAFVGAAVILYAADENGGTAAKPSPEEALKAKLDKLIAQLGSQKYEEREAARTELLKIGWDAREALKEALKNPDPEISGTAKEILEEIGPVSITLECVDADGARLKNKKVAVTATYSRPTPAEVRPLDMTGDARSVKKERQTDDNGVFSLGPLKWDSMQLTIKAEGYATVSTRPFRYQDGKHVLRVRFDLPGVIKGVILDADNGDKPVAKAQVIASNSSVMTDDEGRFELKDVPPGQVTLQIYVTWPEGNGSSGTYVYKPVIVKPGATVERVFKCSGLTKRANSKQRTVKFTLQTPDGKPLATSYVSVMLRDLGESDDEPYRNVTYMGSYNTDPNGTAAIGVSWGNHQRYTVTLFAGGYAPVDLGEHDFSKEAKWEIGEPVKLQPGLKTTVVVKDTNGNPLPHAYVYAQTLKRGSRNVSLYLEFRVEDFDGQRGRRPGPQMIEWGYAETDASGAATVPGLEQEETAFRAFCVDYMPSETKTVVLGKGKQQAVELTLVKCAHVNMKILDEETKKNVPDANSGVWWSSGYYSHTDEPITGHIHGSTQAGIPPGKQILTASAPGYFYGYAVKDLKPSEIADVTIMLKKIGRGAVSCKIQPSKDIPLAGIAYAALSMETYVRVQYPDIMPAIDKDGSFTVSGLCEGKWRLVIRDFEDNIIGRETFTIQKDKTTGVKAQLKSVGSLDIVFPDLKESDGNDSLLTLSTSDDTYGGYSLYNYPSQARIIVPGANKKYSVGRLPEGQYRLSAQVMEDSGSVGFSLPVEVNAGQAAALDAPLHKTLTLKIKGLPLRGVHWGLQLFPGYEMASDSSNRLVRYVALSADGTAEVRSLMPGKYHVIATSNDKRSYITDIEIGKDDASKEVELRLPGKLRTFSGRVRNYAYGRYAGGSYVVLLGDSVCEVSVQPDGTFEGKVPQGKYKIFLKGAIAVDLTDDEKRGLKDITIEDGKDLTGIELR
jgi:hypothetical protein